MEKEKAPGLLEILKFAKERVRVRLDKHGGIYSWALANHFDDAAEKAREEMETDKLIAYAIDSYIREIEDEHCPASEVMRRNAQPPHKATAEEKEIVNKLLSEIYEEK